ncbi:FtsW/RodA/SpoVE family cell cycle protein [Paenibacillus chondroitinus]|uniref:FtsW/RodA/SpoVE family cell cycle protein n=1 Tax=Paenibacillus chondroitinus TaxID=59842 RepID=A0ABU6DAR1_9BACL|nr:FtsW/RodA/SpoVE family cell cycle protein [Paenibacillus chondroitinus]MCY9659001.1 FtsW/RodA/SpoVE family cell cycle protein [Paenibacillus anseongense]MEB4794831.1 FtsW/RodA/SpoVE family cell cycle protein [Paenibacillus chondroitinus]
MLAKLKNIDIPIVVILFAFMVISTMTVYSASVDHPSIVISISKILILYAVGLLAFLACSLFDYRVLIRIAPVLYGIGIVSLVAVYFFGKKIHGARGWFELPGGLTFQPAELVKLILIICVTALLAKRGGELLQIKNDLIPVCAAVLLPFILVLIQPDLGNAIIFVIILLGMLWIGNIKYTHVLLSVVIFAGLGFLLLTLYKTFHTSLYDALKGFGFSHWMDRIDTYLYPQDVTEDDSYQVKNAIRAIGSGGLEGEGYLKGTSVHSNFIPFAYSDSIFVVVGEEFGFRGSAVLLLIYFLLIYRMILISIQSTQLSGAYIVVGVVSMFVFQIFENVGMMIGIMPLTGITLPFVSYGGTSLLINMLSLGLVMSVKLHQDREPELF